MLNREPGVRSCVLPAGPVKVLARAEARCSSAAPILSLVVPTYNEAANIQLFLERIRGVLDPVLGSRYEVIVVDDNSPDGTCAVVAAMQAGYPQLSVLRREHARGLATAVLRGWQEAQGDILGTINADFQHPPELLRKMLELAREAELVIATRHAEMGSFGELPWRRRLLSRGASRVGQLWVPQIFSRVSDPLSGYYLLRREAIEGIELRPNGFKTLIEVLARGRIKTIAECGYTMRKRERGQSKARWRQWMEYLVQLKRLRGHAGARHT